MRLLTDYFGANGRLDGGSLDILQRSAKIRSEYHLEGRTVKVEEVLSALDFDPEASFYQASGHEALASMSFVTEMQFGTLTSVLSCLIENEPNAWLKERMMYAVSQYITECLIEKGLDDRSRGVIAQQKVGDIDFSASTVEPPINFALYAEIMTDELCKTQWSDELTSMAANDVEPSISHLHPDCVGEAMAFRNCYLEYEPVWRQMEGTAKGHLFALPEFVSTADVPVVVIRVYEKRRDETRSETTYKQVASGYLLTSEVMDVSQPLQFVTVSLRPQLTFDVVRFEKAPSKGWRSSASALEEIATVEATFSFMWQLRHFFRSTAFDPDRLDTVVRRSIGAEGETIYLLDDESVGIRCRSELPFSGELTLQTLFKPTALNRSGHLHECDTIEEMRIRFTSDYVPRVDFSGARILPLLYNPNLNNVHRLVDRSDVVQTQDSRADEGVVTEKVKFQQSDILDCMRYESVDKCLQIGQLSRWRDLLHRRDREGQLVMPDGPAQWKKMIPSIDVYQRYPADVNVNVTGTTYEAFCVQPPRFLIEVWLNDGSGRERFCGECLLPNVIDLKHVMQQRKLFQLERQSVITRPDLRKDTAAGFKFQGWLHMHFTWRVLNAKMAHLSVKCHELRDIHAEFSTPSQQQPGVPQVRVFMMTKDHATNGEGVWAKEPVMTFTPFHYALYFLHKGQAEESMVKRWRWNVEEMGAPEPDWKNYFGWAEPGFNQCEEREVAVPMDLRLPIPHHLRFAEIDSLVDGNNENFLELWRKVKGGIPRILRPYIWIELSYAAVAQKRINRLWREAIPKKKRLRQNNAFAFLVQLSQIVDLPIFEVIDEDVEYFKDCHGVSNEVGITMGQVLKALLVFSSMCEPDALSLAHAGETTTFTDYVDIWFSVGRGSGQANVGKPIRYSRALGKILYRLLMNTGNHHLSPEMSFYLLFSVTMGGHTKDSDVIDAPFYLYHGQIPHKKTEEEIKLEKSRGEITERRFVGDRISYAIRDCLLIRSAIEVLFPQEAEKIHRTGTTFEELLYAPLMAMCSDHLPSQSLYRLWDMVFMLISTPPAVVESTVSLSDVQGEMAAISLKKTDNFRAARRRPICKGPSQYDVVIDEKSETMSTFDGRHRNATKTLYQGSFGRRVLTSFLFSVLLRSLRDLPQNPNSEEVIDGFTNELRGLRDPSLLVRMTERGDFLLHSSNLNLDMIGRLHCQYMSLKQLQLTPMRKQEAVIGRLMQPYVEAFGQTMPPHIAGVIANDVKWLEDKFRGLPISNKNRVGDWHKCVYPALKYHALFAPRHERWLPDDGLGRIFVKVDQLEFDQPFEAEALLMVKVGKQYRVMRPVTKRIKDKNGASHKFVLTGDCVFAMVLNETLPYKLSFHLLDPTDKEMRTKLISSQKAVVIAENEVKGANHKYLGPSFFKSEVGDVKLRLWFSYALIDAGSILGHHQHYGENRVNDKQWEPGQGLWGPRSTHYNLGSMFDYRKFHDQLLYKLYSPVIDAEQTTPMAEVVALDQKVAHKIPIQGLSRARLAEMLFHSIPSALAEIDNILLTFGKVKDCNDITAVHDAEVSLVELFTHFVLTSRGSYLKKASLLFDMFGHYEKAKDEASNGKICHFPYYNLDPYCMSKTAHVLSERWELCLPAGSMDEIRRDARTLVNVITVAEIAPMVQIMLTKNGIHFDNYQIWQLAHHVFEPGRNNPGLLAAALVCEDPIDKELADVIRKTQDQSGSDIYSGHVGKTTMTGIKKVIKSKIGQKHQESTSNVAVDVSYGIQRYMERRCNESNFFGVDLTSIKTLSDMKVSDPFVGYRKSIRIALTDGTPDQVTILRFQVEGDGTIVSGMGGNYSEQGMEFHCTAKQGVFGHTRPDVIIRGSPLFGGTFMFNSYLPIDKKYFFGRLLGNELLLDCLIKPTACDRLLCDKEMMNIDALVQVSVGREQFLKACPVVFKNEQEVPDVLCLAHQEEALLPHQREGLPSVISEATKSTTTVEDTECPACSDSSDTDEEHATVPDKSKKSGSSSSSKHDAVSAYEGNVEEQSKILSDQMSRSVPALKMKVPDRPRALTDLVKFRVHVFAVTDVYNTMMDTSTSPYVKVNFGNQKKKTQPARDRGAYTPFRNGDMEYYTLTYSWAPKGSSAEKSAKEVIKVAVYDNRQPYPVNIGHCFVSVADLLEKNVMRIGKKSYPLEKAVNPGATVTLGFSWLATRTSMKGQIRVPVLPQPEDKSILRLSRFTVHIKNLTDIVGKELKVVKNPRFIVEHENQRFQTRSEGKLTKDGFTWEKAKSPEVLQFEYDPKSCGMLEFIAVNGSSSSSMPVDSLANIEIDVRHLAALHKKNSAEITVPLRRKDGNEVSARLNFIFQAEFTTDRNLERAVRGAYAQPGTGDEGVKDLPWYASVDVGLGKGFCSEVSLKPVPNVMLVVTIGDSNSDDIEAAIANSTIQKSGNYAARSLFVKGPNPNFDANWILDIPSDKDVNNCRIYLHFFSKPVAEVGETLDRIAIGDKMIRCGHVEVNVAHGIIYQQRHSHPPPPAMLRVVDRDMKPTGAEITLNVDYYKPPRVYPKLLRVSMKKLVMISSDSFNAKTNFLIYDAQLKRLETSDKHHLLDAENGAVQRSEPIPLSTDKGDVPINLEEYFEYNGCERLSINFLEIRDYTDVPKSSSVLASASFDVWGMLRRQRDYCEVNIPLCDPVTGISVGHVECMIKFLNPPPLPWPHWIECNVVSVRGIPLQDEPGRSGCGTFALKTWIGHEPRFQGPRSQVYPNSSRKAVPVALQSIMPYKGQKDLRMVIIDPCVESYIHGDSNEGRAVAQTNLDIWELLRREKTNPHDGREDSDIIRVQLPLVDQFSFGSIANGVVTADIRFRYSPQKTKNYCKVTVRHGAGLYKYGGEERCVNHKKQPYVIAEMPNQLRERTLAQNEANNRVRWHETFIWDYDNQPRLQLSVTDTQHFCAKVPSYIGACVIDLWDHLHRAIEQKPVKHDHVRLYKRGRKVGKISVDVEFYDVPPVKPLLLRVAVRSAVLTSDGKVDKSSPYISVNWVGSNGPPVSTKVVKMMGTKPIYDDELMYLPFDQAVNNKHFIEFKCIDSVGSNNVNNHRVIGSTMNKIHVWDLLRDHEKTWAGRFQLGRETSSEHCFAVGEVHVSISLVYDVVLPVKFRTHVKTLGPACQDGHGFSVGPRDTTEQFCRTVEEACRELKLTSNHPRAQFYAFLQAGLGKSHRVFAEVANGHEFEMKVGSYFVEFPTIKALVNSWRGNIDTDVPLKVRLIHSQEPLTEYEVDGSEELTRYPCHLSLMNPPSTKSPEYRDQAFTWSIPRPKPQLTLDKIRTKMRFLLHAASGNMDDVFCPARNMMWARRELTETNRKSLENFLDEPGRRANRWHIGLVYGGTNDAYYIELLNPKQTMRGHDTPSIRGRAAPGEVKEEWLASELVPFNNDGSNTIYRPNDEPWNYPAKLGYLEPSTKPKRSALWSGSHSDMSIDPSTSQSRWAYDYCDCTFAHSGACDQQGKARAGPRGVSLSSSVSHSHNCHFCHGEGRLRRGMPGFQLIGMNPDKMMSIPNPEDP